MKPVILLDVDGPLTDGFNQTFCDYLQDEGVHAIPSQTTSWNFSNYAPGPVISRVYDRMREPGTCLKFKPNEGAKEFVQNLRSWATVLAVTSPLNGAPTWANDREVWLTDHLDFNIKDIVSIRDKVHVFGHAIIDDKTSNVVEWAKRWQCSEAILWNAPYNLRDNWNPRASDYFDVLGLLAKLKERQ